MKGLLTGRSALVLALGWCAHVLLASGCGDECVGGYVRPETGACEPKCDPTKCVEGNTCVDNHCILTCDEHTDCVPESQACLEAVEDATLLPIRACLSTGRARVQVVGVGTPCPFGDAQCQVYICPDGAICDPAITDCEATDCKQAKYCPDGRQCDPKACGGNPAACTQACPGGATDCNLGTCADTGLPCVFSTCDAASCHPMTCLGGGEGDANAYCANRDCTDDAACAAGFYCSDRRDPHPICDTTKGNNAACGTTLEPCVASADFSANGYGYSEGPLCLMRSICRKRDECAPCETHFDCNANLGDVCAQLGGASACARFCDTPSDCYANEFCQPATCATTATPDECAGKSVCAPAGGTCAGSGAFCEPCLDDFDCGTAAACADVVTTPGAQAKETACVELALARCLAGISADCANVQSCDTSNDCPMSPSGDFGYCVSNDAHPLFGKCAFPLDAEGAPTCWP